MGGGFITDKAKPMTPNGEAIRHIAGQIADAHRQYPEIDFIIGNGVGSYAHFTAHEYGLREGIKDRRGVYGAAKTHLNAQKISMLFTEELLAQNLPAFTFSPASMLVNGQKKTFFAEPLQQALDSSMVPIVHGDTILDAEQGVKIFSTEKILQECLEYLRGAYEKVQVVYFANTDGVYDTDNRTVAVLERGRELAVDYEYGHDVTGGIVGKVESARKAADIADEVFIVGGWQNGVLLRIIERGDGATRVI